MRVSTTIDKQKLPRMCLSSSQIDFQTGKYGRSTGSTDLRQPNARGAGNVISKSESPLSSNRGTYDITSLPYNVLRTPKEEPSVKLSMH